MNSTINSANEVITANELKTNGVALLEKVIEKNQSAIISVRGKEKYVVLPFDVYNALREFELEKAIAETKADIAKKRFHTDGVKNHLKRVNQCLK